MSMIPGGLGAQTATPVASQSDQENSAQQLEKWEKTARRAEEAIASQRASDAAFQVLRRELVIWREKFLADQNINKNAIKTLQDQITALGEKPEGEPEDSEIAAKRKMLDQQMAVLVAPVKTAEVAHSRASGLIRSIDEIIRSRQTDALLKLDTSPINPAHWGGALAALGHSFDNLRKETAKSWANPVSQVALKNNLPVILALLLAALVLLLRGRRWSGQIAGKLQAKSVTPARWLFQFLLSIAQLLLPLAGLFLLLEAISISQLLDLHGQHVLEALVFVGVSFVVSVWLGMRIFPPGQPIQPPLNLPIGQRQRGRFFAGVLGLLIGLRGLINDLAQFEKWSQEALIVLSFPILLLMSYALLRLANLLRYHVENEQQTGQDASYRNTVIHYFSRVLGVLALIGPVLAAVGYFKAAQAVTTPTALSLGLLAFLSILNRMTTEIYALIVRSQERAREALIPVLVNFMLVLLSLPFFALIWGARVTDLTEVWARFQVGFTFGDTRISPAVFMTFAIVFVIGYILTRFVQGTLRNTVLPKTKIDLGGRNAITSGVGYIGIFLSALVAISSAGIDLSSLAIVAGALSVGIGFGLQNIVSNFVSGIILLIERPISQGDWIEVGGHMGIVRDISVRSTRIETFDRSDVIVPNSDFISGSVTNYTRGNTVGRLKVPVGVAYGTDTKRVEALLRQIAEAHPMVLANPKPAVLFRGFGADSLDFEIRAILRDVNWSMSVHSDMNHEIARVFAEENIEIPFAQRDLWLRNPEVLKGDNGQGEPE
ncbi:MAG: mechanosensitive ion channel protein MscS [Rhodobacterales bacterium]|nr:MAG: mechanosensitive ion channel protein MscS [Rhodobacterales bacterium]